MSSPPGGSVAGLKRATQLKSATLSRRPRSASLSPRELQVKLLFKKTVLRRADPGRPQFRFSPGGTAEEIEPSPEP